MLRFVRRARDQGFKVERIAELLALWRDRSRHSADVKQLALSQVEGLRRKIREIKELVANLEHLARGCNGDHRPDCPILADLEGDASIVSTDNHTGQNFGRSS